MSPQNPDAFSCTGDKDDFLLFSIDDNLGVQAIRKDEDSTTGFSVVHLFDEGFKKMYKAQKLIATKGANGEAIVAVISQSSFGQFVFLVCTDFKEGLKSSDRWTLCGNLPGDEITRFTVDTTVTDPVLAVAVRSGAEIELYHYDQKQKSLQKAPSAMEAYGVLDLSVSHNVALEEVSEGRVDFLLASLHKVTPGKSNAKAGLVLTSFPDNQYFNTMIDVDDDTRVITTVNRPNSGPGIFSDLFTAGSKLYYYDTKAQTTREATQQRVQIPGPLLQTPKKMEAERDEKGNLHLWILQSNGDLSYTYQDPRNGGNFTELNQFAANVGNFSSHVNEDGSLYLFTVGGAAGNIVHNYMESVTMTWVETPVSLPLSTDIVDTQVCMTEMSIDTGSGENPTDFPEFSITASKPCFAKINGKGVFLNRFTAKKIKPNFSGYIQIAQSMDSMSLARIKVESTLLEHSLEIDGNSLVQKKLKTTTASSLRSAVATDAYGQNSVPVTTEEDEGKLSNAAEQLSWLSSAAQAGGFKRVKPSKPTSSSFMRVKGNAVDQGVVFSMPDGVFNNLDKREVAKFLTKKPSDGTKKEAKGSMSGLSWFMKQIESGVMTVIDFFVEITDDILHFFVDVGGKILRFVVDTVEDLMPWMGVVWKWIKAGLKQVLKWIGDVIGIGGILDTTRALKKITNDGIKYFIDTLLVSLEDRVDDQFESLKKAVRAFNSKELLGDAYDTTQRDVEKDSNGTSALMKNQKVTHYTNHLQNGSFHSSTFADPGNNGPTNIDDTDVDNVEWTDLLDKIMNLATSSSVGQMLDSIQNILEVIIDLAQSAIDGMFDVVRKSIHHLQTFLNSPASIPLIGPIIEALTGEKISVMDFVCFLIAAPATWIWKLTNDGKAPFPGGSLPFPSIAEPMSEEGSKDLEKKPLRFKARGISISPKETSNNLKIEPSFNVSALTSPEPKTVQSFAENTEDTSSEEAKGKLVWIPKILIFTNISDIVITLGYGTRLLVPGPGARLGFTIQKVADFVKACLLITLVQLEQHTGKEQADPKRSVLINTCCALYGIKSIVGIVQSRRADPNVPGPTQVFPINAGGAAPGPGAVRANLKIPKWERVSDVLFEGVIMCVWIADRIQGEYEVNSYFVMDCVRQSIKVISVFTYSGAQFFPRTPLNSVIIGVGILGRIAAGAIGIGSVSAFKMPKRTKDFPMIFP